MIIFKPNSKAYAVAIVTILIASNVYAQENVLLHPDKFYKKFLPHLRIKNIPVDSSYIKLYPNYLSAGTHILSPAIFLNIKSRGAASTPPASSRFRTNISDIMGFSVAYRHINAGFAFLLPSGSQKDDNYPSSYYRTATIKYNGAANSFQFKYLKLKGLTDYSAGSVQYPSGRYLDRQDIQMKEFQFEELHNFNWKKYSYIAPLTFSQRQVKSAWGFMFKAGLYYSQISGDSALISKKQKANYGDFSTVTNTRSLSIKLSPGIGGTLVFLKRVYFSASLFTSYDLLFYKYGDTPNGKAVGRQTFMWILDGKASLGYQSKRLYAGIRYEAERRAAMLHTIDMTMLYGYGGIEVGYRFNSPKFVRKVYKKTMPPGM